jgi:hypothetical protein
MPFDPGAMVTMLQAFYPVPTVANLRRASQERPDYFAGGTLFGSCGEKLLLPHGQAWDLMYDCGGLNARWQAIDVTAGGGPSDDPFALDPGPLDRLELPDATPPVPDDTFTQIVAGALRELGASDDQLQLAGTVLVEASAPTGLGDQLSAALDDAMRAAEGQQRAIDALTPEDLARAAGDAKTVTDARPGIPDDGDAVPPAQDEPIDPGPAPDIQNDRPPEA